MTSGTANKVPLIDLSDRRCKSLRTISTPFSSSPCIAADTNIMGPALRPQITLTGMFSGVPVYRSATERFTFTIWPGFTVVSPMVIGLLAMTVADFAAVLLPVPEPRVFSAGSSFLSSFNIAHGNRVNGRRSRGDKVRAIVYLSYAKVNELKAPLAIVLSEPSTRVTGLPSQLLSSRDDGRNGLPRRQYLVGRTPQCGRLGGNLTFMRLGNIVGNIECPASDYSIEFATPLTR